MTPEKDARYVPSRDVHDREIDGELIVVDLKRGHYYAMNEVGAHIWHLLQEGRAVSGIGDDVARHFAVSADHAHADVAAFVRSLSERGLCAPARG